jgi:hypothetical protein
VTFRARRVVFGGETLSLFRAREKEPSPDLYVTAFPEWTSHEALAGALGVPLDAAEAPRVGRHGPFAFVRLGSTEAASTVLARLEANPAVVDGCALSVVYAGKPPQPASAGDAQPPPPTPWLYVGGFPEATSREELAAALAVPLEAVSETTASRGGWHAFVELPSMEAAEELVRRHADVPATLGGAPLTLAPGGAGPTPPSATLVFGGVGGNTAVLRSLLALYNGLFDPFSIRRGACAALRPLLVRC